MVPVVQAWHYLDCCLPLVVHSQVILKNGAIVAERAPYRLWKFLW